MKPKFTIEQVISAPVKSSTPTFELECEHCHKPFFKKRWEIMTKLKKSNFDFEQVKELKYCSWPCKYASQEDKISAFCRVCNKEIIRHRNDIERNTEGSFCDQICFKIYTKAKRLSKTNLIKCEGCGKEFERKDDRMRKHNFCGNDCSRKNVKKFIERGSRSQFEIYLEKILPKNFPTLCFSFNDRKTLEGLELDIFIPELNLAFELNGIHHYKAIYGEETLERTQKKDEEKKILCETKNIKLATIDVRDIKYTTRKYTDKHYFFIYKVIKLAQQNPNLSIEEIYSLISQTSSLPFSIPR